MGFIYKITSPNSRMYVGKTYNIRKRINSHKCASKKETSIILMNSIRKYGWNAHKNKMGINIGSVKDSLTKDTWVSGKYCFRYKGGDIKKRIKVSPLTLKTVKRPIYWLSENLEVITEFPSAKEASDFFGIPKTTINRAAQYNDLNPIRAGHVFCYKDEYLEEYKLVS